MHPLQPAIERLSALGEVEHNSEAREAFFKFRDELTHGRVRAAENTDGVWTVNAWVKRGILLGFRIGELRELSAGPLSFVDKDTFPARRFSVEIGRAHV